MADVTKNVKLNVEILAGKVEIAVDVDGTKYSQSFERGAAGYLEGTPSFANLLHRTCPDLGEEIDMVDWDTLSSAVLQASQNTPVDSDDDEDEDSLDAFDDQDDDEDEDDEDDDEDDFDSIVPNN